MELFKISKDFFVNLLDIAYPSFCASCKSKLNIDSEEGICNSCFNAIDINLKTSCPHCAVATDLGKYPPSKCSFCKDNFYHFDQVYSVCTNTGIVKTGIHLFKYKRKRTLGRKFARLMLMFIKQLVDTSRIDVVVPVPLHLSKINERGFNQAAVLGKIIAQELSLDIDCDNLIRQKLTHCQHSLRKPDRFKNIDQAFKCLHPEKFNNKHVLLVDDIFTTGATLNECAHVLKRSGARKVIAITLAR